jgi:hypothetical protein
MTASRFVVALPLALAVVAGCSSGQPELPDRSAASVRAEEARIAEVLGADSSVVGGPSECRVRLLGQESGASFVWAECKGLEPPHTAVSTPLRVDGSKVTMPGDGAAFPHTVRELFPKELADFVLKNPGSPELRP